MKSYFYYFLLLLASLAGYSQEIEKLIPQEFETALPTKEDKGDLPRLRNFLENKDLQYNRIQSSLSEISANGIYSRDSATYKKYRLQLQTFLDRHKENGGLFGRDQLDNNIRSICEIAGSLESYTDEKGVTKAGYNVEKAINNIDYWISTIARIVVLTANAENVSKDRDAATRAIQTIYNVEKGDQEYKKTISLYYAVIIFSLIMVSFLFLFKKSSPEIGNDFLNGNGLQFIALFAIIISTILFGILGILEGKELAAILSGISGFILGKGLNVNLTKKGEDAAEDVVVDKKGKTVEEVADDVKIDKDGKIIE